MRINYNINLKPYMYSFYGDMDCLILISDYDICHIIFQKCVLEFDIKMSMIKFV